MILQMQSTIFGQLVRLVSRNGKFKYPDEIDPSLWKNAVQRPPLQEPQQPPRAQEPGSPNGQADGSEKGVQKGDTANGDVEKDAQSCFQGDGPDDILVVGWYGPDDPEVSDSADSDVACSFVPDADKIISQRTPRTGLVT